jgi:hypothetical protein
MPIETEQPIDGDAMNSPEVNVANNHSAPFASGRGSAQRGGNELQRIADQRPEAALQRQVQAWGDGSERVGQLRAWQGVADGRGVGGKRQDLTTGFAHSAGLSERTLEMPNLPPPSGPTAQLVKTTDHGGQDTKKWYDKQIKSTNTTSELESVVKSMGPGSGVFLSDDINEMQQWLGGDGIGINVNSLVVPNRDVIKDDQSNFLNLPDYMKKNGLTKVENCETIAEHELVHLKHAHSNLKSKVGGAGTSVGNFNAGNIVATVDSLLVDANALVTRIENNDITRLSNAKTYLVERITYIKTTWNSKNTNAEAPSVLRELSRHLTITLKGNEDPGWAGLRDSIYAFDRACAEAIDMKPAKKSGNCFLTTACTQARGLPDDCHELTTLRRFRDEHLLAQPDGGTLVTAYYTHAPSIVHAIRRRRDEEELLARIYGVIEGCVGAIEAGDQASALRMYCELMRLLMEHFVRELPAGAWERLAKLPRLQGYATLPVPPDSALGRLGDALAAHPAGEAACR